MFCDFLYCADCGSKLWYHTNTTNKEIHYFSCSNYKKDRRGVYPNSKIRIREKVSRHKELRTDFCCSRDSSLAVVDGVKIPI